MASSRTSRRWRRVAVLLTASLAATLCTLAEPSPPEATAATFPERTYTTSADFDEGTTVNVDHAIPDQLQLAETTETFGFIWVALSSRGTVAKIDTATGQVLGEYWSAPQNRSKNPSRTTVDQDGNVWVGNRDESSSVGGTGKGSVVHLGLEENGQCEDRNHNGQIDTSNGLGDIRAWPNAAPSPDTDGGVDTATDECVIAYVRTNARNVRHVSVTPTNDVWVGGPWGSGILNLLTPAGVITRTINMGLLADTGETSATSCCYGGLVDPNGVLWTTNNGPTYVVRVDPSRPNGDPNLVTRVNTGRSNYGMGIDPAGNIWVTNYHNNSVQKISSAGVLLGTFPTGGASGDRGVTATADGDIWVANSGGNTVSRLSNAGVIKAVITVGSTPTGVSVDRDGKVWSTNLSSHSASRIDPATNTADLTVNLKVAGLANPAPYNYSDMTGSTLTGRPDEGTWTTTYDAGAAGSTWPELNWTESVPGDSSLRVFAASSTDGVNFGPEVEAAAGTAPGVDPGRYLRVRVAFARASTGESPVLYDLTIGQTNDPPVADAGADQTVTEGAVVTLDGSGSSDPNGDPLTYTWRITGAAGPPITLTSTTAPTVSFATADDGVYRFELTVSDGRETATDTTTVTVTNAAPTVTAELAPADAGGVTLLSGSFTDRGFVDTHTATIDWGDATPVESSGPAAQGAGWGSVVASHIYTSPGSYTVTVTVTDDDGGTSTAAVTTATIAAPVALFANSTGQRSLWVSGGGQTIDGDSHTNGELRVEGAQKTFTGPTTHSGALTVNGSHTFTPPATQSPVEALPVILPISDYQPGGRAAIEAGAAYNDMTAACSKQGWRPTAPLAAGLYWVPCDVTVTGAGFAAGPVTIATSGTIKVTGSDGNFYQPFIDGALFISSSSAAKAIDVSGSESTFAGYVHAAAGGVEIAGTNHTFYCGIIGDTIRLNGTGTRIVARDCTPPVTAGAVAPMLVPRLGVDLDQTPAAVIPGDTLADTATITNADAIVLAPGIAGVENLSATDTATVTAGEVSFEYYSIPDAAWLPVPTNAPATVVADPNPHPAVTYPTPGGPDPFAGTVIGPGGFATWGTQLQATVAPGTIEMLLDPLRVAAVRTRVELTVDPTGVPVRQLYRFGADLAPDLRGQGADLTDAHVTLLAPDGTARFYDQTTTPALATLTPGAAVTIDVSTDIAVPEPIGPTETTTAYLDRLQSLDGTAHVGVATATATGGVGLVLAPQASALSTRHLPIVRPALGGPASTPAGSDATFTLALANTGGATADQLTADATIDANPVPVTGVPATLTAAGLATGEIAYSVPATHPGGTLTAAADTQWSDANGNAYGPADARYSSSVGAKPVLAATLVDALGADRDGSGQPSPGDQVTYTARITNTTATPVTNATFTLTPDPATTLETGSVTTTIGTITTGNTPGDPSVAVAIGTMAASQIVTITFAVAVNDPFPDGLSHISTQGAVTADGAPGSLTDDPATFGPTDPTITPIIRTAPALDATLVDVLFIDTNSDGQPGPGDQLRYTAEITPAGNASVTDVTFTLTPDANSALAVGTVTAATGTISSGNTPGDTTVGVDLGTLGPFDSATIAFDVTIRADAAASQLVAQGTIASPDLTAFGTDDPDTPILDDPTVTQLTGSGGGGTAGPAIEGCTPDDDGATITTPTAITCDLTPKDGTTIDTWAVTARPADAEATTQPVVIATGTGTPPAPLGTFDPTLVDDGIWIITITATGSDGGTTTIDTSIIVDGQLKLGRYHITYQDMAVPVGGIPIQVLRTYDTLNKNQVGDFGHGWTLDVSDFRVQVNRPLGQAGWERYVCGGGIIFVQYCFRTTRSHYVTVTWPDGHTETFDFTPQGLSSFYGGAGIAKYTGRANTTSRLEPAPGQEALGWSGDGNLYDDPFNYTTTYNPTRFVLVAKDGTRYTLDRNTGLVQAEDRNGNTVTIDDTGIHSSLGPDIDFTRDTQDRITAVTGPDDRAVTYTYTPTGDLDTVTDPNNHTTSFDYTDHALATITDALGYPFQTLEYNPDGRLTAITDANNNRTEVAVDLGDRKQSITSPDGRQTTISTFDERGNETERTDAFDGTLHNSSWTYSTDGRDLVTSRTDPNGNSWAAAYDDDGNITEFIDAKGNTSSITYGTYGLPTQLTDRGSGVTSFAYDDRGNLTTLTDPLSRTRTWTYSPAGLAVTYADDLALRRSWSYTSRGQIASMSDALGTTTFAYDANGHLVSEQRPEGPVTYTYDNAGRLTAVTDASGTTGYGYDAADHITSVATSAGTVTYTYRPDGRRATLSSPQATTTYGYDPAGRVTTLSDSLAGTISFSHVYGGTHTVSRPNGVTTTNIYDDAGRLTRIDHVGPGGLIEYFAYTLDPNGNPTEVESTQGVEAYSLDSLDRLTAVTYPNGDSETFTYNAAGDRITSAMNGSESTYNYDAAGRLSTVNRPTGTVGYTWDGNGNLTSTTAGETYTWTSRNMMDSATVGAMTQNYSYDATDVRVAVDGEPWLWDRSGGMTRLLSKGSTSVLSGFGASNGSDFRWTLGDRLGSTRAETDATGATVGTASYSVYGDPRQGTGQLGMAGFTGQQSDETGLLHLRSRQYAPSLGQFLSVDSILKSPGDFAMGRLGSAFAGLSASSCRTSPSDYGYALSNPTRFSDPAGTSSWEDGPSEWVLGCYDRCEDDDATGIYPDDFLGDCQDLCDFLDTLFIGIVIGAGFYILAQIVPSSGGVLLAYEVG